MKKYLPSLLILFTGRLLHLVAIQSLTPKGIMVIMIMAMTITMTMDMITVMTIVMIIITIIMTKVVMEAPVSKSLLTIFIVS